jgi:hypothetical protein
VALDEGDDPRNEIDAVLELHDAVPFVLVAQPDRSRS